MMDIKRIIDLKANVTGISGFFAAYGSFGVVDGADRDVAKMMVCGNGMRAEYEVFTAECTFEELENGVISRRDSFTAKTALVLNRYAARFCLEGGDYEVYSQFSGWQTESLGGWQPLVTGIEIANLGVRTAECAAPMAALRNRGSGKMLVLHLLPNAQWKISVKKCAVSGKNSVVVIEAGINDKGLNMKVAAGETIDMPRLLLFEAKSALDLDAWKLHAVCDRLWPRRELPVIYNTWLLHFDTINVDNILRQADCAAELGVELFLIDAGWFGFTDNWGKDIGNWTENQNGGFFGRVKEVSEHVRSLGMRFGMWLEPERALTCTDAYKTHPNYYKAGSNGNAFLDFAKEEARRYITDIALNLIETYNLGFFKFDFNAALAYDDTGDGFYRYFKSVRRFITEIREKHPDLYITNCASGGYRMDLAGGAYYDSFWPSDNQSPLYGMRIFKDTAKRLPPCHIEKWDVRRFVGTFPEYGQRELVSRPLSCNGATWDNVLNVQPRYTHAFLTGGPIGFSTDIAGYPDEEKRALKEHIRLFKQDRDFYQHARMRILYDTQDIIAIEYSDAAFSRIIVQVFANILHQDSVTVYPVANISMVYRCGDREIAGGELEASGLTVGVRDIDCVTVEFVAVK